MWDSAAFLLAISATSTSGSQVQTQKLLTSGASINEEDINGAAGAAYNQISSTGFLLVCSSLKFQKTFAGNSLFWSQPCGR